MELAAGATMSRPNKLSPALLEEIEKRQFQVGLLLARIDTLARALGVRFCSGCSSQLEPRDARLCERCISGKTTVRKVRKEIASHGINEPAREECRP
jgi:hypothetical protein